MRSSLVTAVAAGALVCSAVPAAHSKVTPVDGNRFAKAGLTALNQACHDPLAAATEPAELIMRPGPGDVPIGSHTAGWRSHGLDFGAGWVGHVKTPASLTRMRIHVFSPSQEAEGMAVAYHHPDGDSGYWFGTHSLGTDTEQGWHAVNAATELFLWRHYTADGVNDLNAPSATIPDRVKSSGGNADGAELGFIFGCDENAFFVDKLELRTAHDDRTFDFGGFRTRGKLWIGETSPKRVVLRYGYDLPVTGSLHEKWDSDRLAGVLKFQSRRSGGPWRTFGKDAAKTDAKASQTISPSVTKLYRLRYDGTNRFEGSFSPTVKIIVRNRVTARLVDASVVKGHTFTAAGHVGPAKRTGILLQRHLGGRWRTVKKGVTAKDGDFRISAVAADAGTSYWRIKSRAGGGTIGNVSGNLKLNVAQPSGGGGGTDDPEPPPPPPPEG